MKAAQDVFLRGLEDLRAYIRAIELQWDLLKTETLPNACSEADAAATALKQRIGNGVAKRRFDYNSIIISLYGLLEQYIEALARAYAAHLNNVIPNYGEMPEPIRRDHIHLTYELISRSDQPRYRGSSTVPALVANLHSCLSGSGSYRLNTDAFAHHTANFRREIIDQTFSRLGIQAASDRAKYYPSISAYLEMAFPNRELNSLTTAEIFYPLEDLAQRRNDVAHGTASDLLANEMLISYIDFFAAYGAGLCELVRGCAYEFEVLHHGVELGAPIAVHNGSIVCLALKNSALRVGDILVAETGDSAIRYVGGPIAEIQVNHVPVTDVPAQPTVDVGMRVGFRAKANYRYHLLRQPTRSPAPSQRTSENNSELAKEGADPQLD